MQVTFLVTFNPSTTSHFATLRTALEQPHLNLSSSGSWVSFRLEERQRHPEKDGGRDVYHI
jgi:hypothetical protein